MASVHSQSDIISVGIETPNGSEPRKLNQTNSLEEIIEELCLTFALPYKEGEWALRLKMVGAKDGNKYINESNRSEMKNGSMLKLVCSPCEMANLLMQKINSNGQVYPLDENAIQALETLQGLSSDPLFAKEFVVRDGLNVIFYLISLTKLPHDQLVSCLVILDSIMRHKFAFKLPCPVIERIVRFVVDEKCPGPEIIRTSLAILAQLVADGDDEYVVKSIGSEELIPHLWNQDNQEIQENALRLINKLAHLNKRKLHSSIISKKMKETIAKNILGNEVPPSSKMAVELFEYQTLVLSSKEKKLRTQIDPVGREAASIIKLNQITAQLTEGTRSSVGSLLDDQMSHLSVPLNKSTSVQDFPLPPNSADFNRPRSTMGRLDGVDASLAGIRRDLRVVMMDSSQPVSRLTLECMLYFADKYPKQFIRVMQAEEASWQPFPATCERVLTLVVKGMSVQRSKPKLRKYQPLLFHEPAFLEEVFCRMFLQLGRTRRDMKARTSTDQEKVLWVLQRQLEEALSKQPKTLKDLTNELRNYNYLAITCIWLKEWEQEENSTINKSPAILALKESRKEEVIGLIRQQRINLLLKGNTFPKSFNRNKSKKRSTFVVLSSNQKSFHYHDCHEDGRTIPGTSGKISMSDVKSMVVGKRCPHVIKEERMNNKFEYELAFSLLLDLEPSSSYDFIAPDQETFDYWTDAINVILCQDMTSKTMESELKMLLDMEVRLQLLDIRNNDIPRDPPQIPSPPENYSFQSDS